MNAGQQRDQRIDALRGFALGGIVLVNIQSFLYGATQPLGYLTADASALDRAAYFATAAFVSVKFMPIFAMLFGVGFGLFYQRLAALTAAPAAIYRRRMLFLFVFGLLHGVTLYFGDITHLYAVAGLVLLLYVDGDVAAIARGAAMWWVGAVVATGLLLFLAWDVEPTAESVADEVGRSFEIFAAGGYIDQLPQRVSAFVDVIIAGALNFPLTVALMLTGLLAQRAGWFAHRDARAWRWATRTGLGIGLPFALIYAAWSLTDVERDGLGAYSVAAMVPMMASLPLAFFHVAAFVRWAPDALVRWLAPAGRMPLTNYFGQSVAMGALLSGWGLALGPRLSYAQLAALALAIYVVQIVASRLWLARMRQGPLEAVWRNWTYRPLRSSATRSAG